MSTIKVVYAREILDSRGRPTVEVDVVTERGVRGRASVPSGASTGRHEALELRDGDGARHAGRGVGRAVDNVNHEIAGIVVGHDVLDQRTIDEALCKGDGTETKSRLGANAILGVSMAVARAAALERGLSLWQSLPADSTPVMPLPMVNMVSGGAHAAGGVDFQDFLIVPLSATSCRDAIEMALEVHRALGSLLRAAGQTVLMADEGGFGPPLPSNEAAVDLVVRAIGMASFEPGKDVAIALDVASSEFFREASGNYELRHPRRHLTGEGMVALLEEWCARYPIISIEDGCAEDDWDGWKLLSDRLGSRIQLIGDDLFTTNPVRLQRGIDRGVANSILVKMNQIGTITETLDVCSMARAHGYAPVVSARSGETEDPFLADLAVATGAGQIKIGCVRTSERMAKYNQLLRIEDEMGPRARFPGRKALAP